jgi:hypothetical protein
MAPQALFDNAKTHQVLECRVCLSCHDRWEEQTWPKDDEGKEENCVMCSNDGELMMCDNCPRALCQVRSSKTCKKTLQQLCVSRLRVGSCIQLG